MDFCHRLRTKQGSDNSVVTSIQVLQWTMNILPRERVVNTRYIEIYSVGEEGALDGKNEQEEDGDELPATGADVLAGTAKHDAQVAKQKHDHKQRDGNPPYIGLERDKKTKSKTYEKGIGARGYTQ